MQIQPLANLRQQRHAELPPPVSDHKVDHLGGHFVSGGDKISLVLTVLGVDDNHHSSRGNGCDGVLDIGKMAGHAHSIQRLTNYRCGSCCQMRFDESRCVRT